MGESHSYTFVDSGVYADNSAFIIDGSTLKAASSFDYESRSTYTTKVRSTDHGGLFTEKEFTITVNDINDAPTDIVVSNSSVNESLPAGTVVGELSSDDQDAGDTHIFTLIDTGSYPDNAAFIIEGTTLNPAWPSRPTGIQGGWPMGPPSCSTSMTCIWPTSWKRNRPHS